MKKIETSKLIAYAMILVVFPSVLWLSWRVVGLAELAITLKFTGALPYLTAIITPASFTAATILRHASAVGAIGFSNRIW